MVAEPGLSDATIQFNPLHSRFGLLGSRIKIEAPTFEREIEKIMATDIRVYLSGNQKDPESLQDGNVLLVSGFLDGLIALLEQIEQPEGKFEALKNALMAQYAGKVSDTSSTNPVTYTWVWENGQPVRKCLYSGSLLVQFTTASIVSIDFAHAVQFIQSVVGTTVTVPSS